MKDSGIEWIGEIPEEWEIDKGKAIFRQRNERGNNIELQLLSPSQKFGVVPQSLLEELTSHVAVKVKEETDLMIFKTIHKGDFCISLRSFQGGFEYSAYEGVVSPAYQVFYPFKTICDSFYKYLFKIQPFIDKMNSYTMTLRDGKNIAFSDFGNSYIPYPPVVIQYKIADVLDEKCVKIDSLIAHEEATIEELKAYKQSVIDETISDGHEKQIEINAGTLQWKAEPIEEWMIVKTLHCLEMAITDGPHETPELFDSGIPFLSAEAVKNGKLNFELKRGYISKEYYEECCKKYCPRKHDVFMIKSGATTGNVAIVETDEIFTIWSPLAVFRANNRVIPKYLYYLLQTKIYLEQVRLNWSFGTQQNIGMRVLETLKLLIPQSVEIQKLLVEKLEKKLAVIESAIEIKCNKIEQLKEYKKSLIYEYITGKKEVA